METKDIIALFSNRFGYVEDIEGVIEYLKFLDIELDRKNEILYEIVQHNNEVEQKSIKDLNMSKPIKRKNEKTIEEVPLINDVEKEKERIINVNSYLNQIRLCNDPDFITEVLPSIYDSNYEEVMIAILMALYNELCFANQMLKQSDDDNEKLYLQDEIEKCNMVIKVIKSYNKDEIDEENCDTFEYDNDKICRLLYLEKSNGSLYVDDDISDINDEDYGHTRNLINILISGRKFSEKRFIGMEDFKGLSAVRNGNSRIVFQRVSNNTIIVLGIFTKRCQNTIAYRDFIKRRAKLFHEQKESLKEKSSDKDFLEYSDGITQNILDSLNNNIVKEKRRK